MKGVVCLSFGSWNLSSSVFSTSPLGSLSSSSSPLRHEHVQPAATSTPTNSHRHISNVSQSANNKHVNLVNQRRRRDEITIVLANCDEVTGKKSSIENMLVSLDPGIFLAVETKLDNSIQNGEILPPHYHSSRNDRKRGGGGVLVASKDNITIPTVNFAG